MLQLQRASAGSGKTYTLTKIYLRDYLAKKIGTDSNGNGVYRLRTETEMKAIHGRILAITFTNKATNEMKQRIVRALADLAGITGLADKDINYLSDFVAEFATTVDKVKEAAKTALNILLHGYSDFQVSTIDSFFQTVLRTLAVETDRNDTYQIELDDKYLSQMGVDSMLSQIKSPADDKTSKEERFNAKLWIKNLVTDMLTKEGMWNPFSGSLYKELIKFSNLFHSEEYKDKVEPALMKYFETVPDLRKVYQDLKEAQRKDYKDHKKRFEDLQTKLRTLINGRQEFINSRYSKLWTAEVPMMGSVIFELGGTIVKLTSMETPLGDEEVIPTAKRKKAPAFPGIVNLMINLANEMLDWEEVDNFWKNNNRKIYYLGLIKAIKDNINKFREENNIIPLNETNRILKDIINDDDTPFIYERIGSYLNHFLIDEFQDTSSLQWHNLEPLVKNSLGEGHDNLIIGDVKQSIYRFRNAEPMLIQETVPQSFYPNCDIRGNTPEENTNWRSNSDVVKFNNSMFTRLVSTLSDVSVVDDNRSVGLGDIYGNVIQRVKNADKPGYVEVSLYKTATKGPFKGRGQKVYDSMGDLVQSLMAKGYEQKDIAFLVDTNSQGEKLIASIFNYNQQHEGTQGYTPISVISEESLKISESKAVKLIVSVLEKLVANADTSGAKPDDKKHRYIQQSDFICNYNYIRSANPKMTPSEILAECFKSGKSNDVFAKVLKQMKTLALPALVENIISSFVDKDVKKTDAAFISAFQDKVLDYCQNNPSDVASFLRWWNESASGASISSPEGFDAVQVMTIHKSKGLEFKCVIIPQANWKLGINKSTNIWVEPKLPEGVEIENLPPFLPIDLSNALADTVYEEDYKRERDKVIVDQLNKTYVAFTRAVDELYIFAERGSTTEEFLGDYLMKCFDYLTVCGVGTEDTFDYTLDPTEISHEKSENPKDSLFTDVYRIGGVTEADVAKWKEEAKEKKANTVEPTTIESYYVNASTNIISNGDDHDAEEDGEIETENATALLDEYESEKHRLEGKKLHAIMEQVVTIDDLPKAIRSMRVKGRISRKEAEDFEKRLRERIGREEVARWFDPAQSVIAERTILCSDKANRRPDRIVITPDGDVEVIDYKFGERHNEAQHVRQVRRYIDLLQSIKSADGKTPKFRNVKGYLWYVNSGTDPVLEIKSK
ncbi:MAG: UvrD-helicase domain-containing protein [Muribaculaceae bacterium]|nr:UvrD-helicase domain-containing protein [Muribaculaceae bacterium]